MSRKVKITVYVTAKNHELYLADAIQSVLQQSFNDWELFIIDDASSDDCWNIIKKYKEIPNTRILKTEGWGLPRIANWVLERARGDYIIRLDGDDLLLENALLILYTKLEKMQDSYCCYGNYILIDENSKHMQCVHLDRNDESCFSGMRPPHGACTLIKIDKLKEINGYDEDLNAQDGLSLFERFSGTYTTCQVEEFIFKYRRHANNLTNSNDKFDRSTMEIYRKLYLENFINRYNVAVIPIRQYFDAYENLWAYKLNGKTLLDIAIDKVSNISEFQKILVIGDVSEDFVRNETVNEKKFEFLTRDVLATNLKSDLKITLREYMSSNNDIDTLTVISPYFPFLQSNNILSAMLILTIKEFHQVIGVEAIYEEIFFSKDTKLHKLYDSPIYDLHSTPLFMNTNALEVYSRKLVDKKSSISRIGYCKLRRYESLYVNSENIADSILKSR